MHTRHTLVLAFLLSAGILAAQPHPGSDLIRGMQRSVCAIKVTDNATGTSVGCGVVVMQQVDGREVYFVATANHIIEDLLGSERAGGEILAFDRSGILYKASGLTRKHVLWRNESLDAALLLLPADLRPEGQIPMNYRYEGMAHLERTAKPEWGQDIYLFGYRWMDEDNFIDILKKGILSVGTTKLPGYEGHVVFLIDNMANKGMSGGLAFTPDGAGIGIISSYVYEVGSQLQNSDDLTVCLPMAFYFQALEDVISTDKSRFTDTIDY